MTTIQISLLIAASASAWAALCWLDVKYHFRFIDWMNGNCHNPFEQKRIDNDNQVSASTKEAEIAELKERIQILEKIVTEPAYELNQKLNKL